MVNYESESHKFRLVIKYTNVLTSELPDDRDNRKELTKAIITNIESGIVLNDAPDVINMTTKPAAKPFLWRATTAFITMTPKAGPDERPKSVIMFGPFSSLCDPRDNFSRKEGRRRAIDYMIETAKAMYYSNRAQYLELFQTIINTWQGWIHRER